MGSWRAEAEGGKLGVKAAWEGRNKLESHGQQLCLARESRKKTKDHRWALTVVAAIRLQNGLQLEPKKKQITIIIIIIKTQH